MLVFRTNPFNGENNSMDLDITPEQVAAYEAGALLQNAFPQLTVGEREFIKTGITEEAWDEMFS